MALLPPIDNNPKIGQYFGPTIVVHEPPMFHDPANTKANYSAETGLQLFAPQYHPALDIIAAEGTPIRASEAGTVVFSGVDVYSGNSLKIEVAIDGHPNTHYSSNHCSRVRVAKGAHVTRGQVIAYVGHTGWANGAHDHFWVSFNEYIGGRWRQNFINPMLLLPGGAWANDARIKPPAPPVATITTLASYVPQRTAVIAPGTTVYGYDPKRPGAPVVRFVATPTSGSNFPVDKKVQIKWPNPAVYNPAPNGTFVHGTAGVFAGLYVPVTSVKAADGKAW